MESSLNIGVTQLDAPHRQALEEVLGQELAAHQRLVIIVIELVEPPVATARPAQSLEDWTTVYDGLNDEEIEAINVIARNRANLTRSQS